jgi:hypothetical protein
MWEYQFFVVSVSNVLHLRNADVYRLYVLLCIHSLPEWDMELVLLLLFFMSIKLRTVEILRGNCLNDRRLGGTEAINTKSVSLFLLEVHCCNFQRKTFF